MVLQHNFFISLSKSRVCRILRFCGQTLFRFTNRNTNGGGSNSIFKTDDETIKPA